MNRLSTPIAPRFDQLVLPLAWAPPVSADHFLIGEAPSGLVDLVLSPERWGAPAAILTGPRKSGKTLLGRIFAEQLRGHCVDDADRRDETELFHLWNRCHGEDVPLLLIADRAPPFWRPVLPDLRSRLGSALVIELPPPDVKLTERLIAQGLERRGHAQALDVAAWLAPRIDRSHIAVVKIIDDLDMLALGARRPLSVALVRSNFDPRGAMGEGEEGDGLGRDVGHAGR